MRFALFALALFSAVLSVRASTFYARQSLPSCAVPCIENANYDGCSPQDNVCMCHSTVFISTTTACIEAECSGTDLDNAIQYSTAICRSVSVTLTSSIVLTGTWSVIAASETSAAAAAAASATSVA
ncbi:hypothetical protein HWV62_34549 [Athelia sp. TMB]|nr:hypothetical protein HWV62_34549 [Athelia sp. TMB]